MVSVLNEIVKLRNGAPIAIDYRNNNRYRVVIQEMNGTKTAYYFSTPVYNIRTRQAVDLKFHKKDSLAYSVGSNANITISDQVRLENAEGACSVSLDGFVSFLSVRELKCGNNRLFPAVNGMMYMISCQGNLPFSFDLEVSKPFMEVRGNDKYFSLMSEAFRPFVTVSCIGTAAMGGDVIAPAKISYQKITDRKYRLTVMPCSPLGKWVMLEINLYEAKLIQDTTVESANPQTNNAFGSSAFIGNTTEFGEQWLYSRPDFAKMSELADKRILKAIVHLPKFNRANVELSAFQVSARFCSFGSNWDNKIAASVAVSDSVTGNGYQDIDITGLLADPRTGMLTRSEGIILKSRVKGSGFSAIATGDSYYAPQIYEIHFR